jgi:superoxide dismutase
MKTIKHTLILSFVLALTAWINPLAAQNYPYELPRLPYGYSDLEPAIDAATMEIHYSKHHAAYVKNLNAALKGSEFESWSLDELMLYASETNDAIRNNAGGHYNHSLFWDLLSLKHPFDKQTPVGKAVIESFGSLDSLNKLLSKAGAARFGSGWAWLYVTPERKLAVSSTPNQDNPIMDVSAGRGVPILAIDVWEHAYYLKYQNRRADYLSAILGAINWEAVNKNYTNAVSGSLLKTIEKETWASLYAFHQVMAQTFHPSEEGNLQPIRQRSEEMVEKALALQLQPIPASFNTPEIKKSIADLVAGSKELNELVKKRTDDKTIAAKLSSLHDVFHTIQGLCRH